MRENFICKLTNYTIIVMVLEVSASIEVVIYCCCCYLIFVMAVMVVIRKS
jgi:hypothetical protein